MRKFFGVAIASLLLGTVTFAGPAPKMPKATGDADWINGPGGAYNQQANTTFNAINTGTGSAAKGSAIYTDANITYTMDVQLLKVGLSDDGWPAAWFAGQVTSVTPNAVGCCTVGNWIFYKVVDKGEPGYADEIWGEDLTAGENIKNIFGALDKVEGMATPKSERFVLNGGNIQVR